ncbi:MAG TPA: CIA30 family protein [Candidatus Solibacter sp.]|nr:CIA30 family protein [Candidatus Solibacter sp.]
MLTRYAATLKVFGWVAFYLLLCAPAVFLADADNGNSFVIRNARVFDGHKIATGTDVWVENGKVKAIGAKLKTPGAKEIDATGDTLLPGFIDSHTHAWGTALKEAEIFGVTTELDMFTDAKYAQQIKREQAEGKDLDLADLRSAGTLATAPGGHGTEYGVTIPTLSSPGEAQAWVDARIAEGSDYIKIVVDDASAYGGHRPTLSMETVKALIDAAHARGKLAVVHIGTQQDERAVIEAGADGLAHLFADSAPDPDFAALVAKHHAFVIPTLTVLEGVSNIASGASLATDARISPYLTDESIGNLKQSFPKFPTSLSERYAEQAVAQLKAAHVPVLAGTDAPNPGTAHGASLHRELELLVRAGLTPQEALASATSVPAAAFHLDDRGTIAVGKRADLVLVKADPTQDITATRDIVSVWKLGVEDDRATYRAGLEQARSQTAKAVGGAGPEAGSISDFEDGTTNAKFGSGWVVSTDSIAGGKSIGEMKIVDGGSAGSKHALAVTGEIDGGLPYAWSGVMFSPGAQMFTPVNLSSKKSISFFAKGDGKTYRVLVFTASGGRIPAQQEFVTGPDWKRTNIPFSAFNGTDGHDISAILFVGGPAAGKFDFQVDDIKLE